ncbi:MAG: D-glycero-beta-D-manno-heptose 1,7-bisphosphate 7-phosphatase [Gammaproteobacteria bacterium]|jgi:D-glycero-D-manno-heptose 1,7-bisphosphate phosphatase
MKLIILDRDGVINEDTPHYIKSAEEWRPIPGSLEAIAKLNHAGYTVIIATNQSGIGRGYFDVEALDEMHAKMQRELAKIGGKIDHIYFCPHTPDDNCDCRKPKTGMFEQIMHDYGLRDLKGVINVGDALREIQVGQIFDCRNILVLTGKGQKTLQDNPDISAEIFQDLAALVNSLV